MKIIDSRLLLIKRKQKILPHILIISIISHVLIYYLNVFNGKYPDAIWLVMLSLLSMSVGCFFGNKFRVIFGFVKHKKEDFSSYNFNKIKKCSFLFITIGILAHIYFYSNNTFSNYADSYTVSQGQGYITVFFNFWLIGMLLLETLSINGMNSPKLKWMNRLLMIIYICLYFFYFLKRRQIILLILACVALRHERLSKKIGIWLLGIFIILLFTVFGKIRGYLTIYGFVGVWEYLLNNFSLEWIELENFEGKYISRTLDDVYHYVNNNGIDFSIFWGIICCVIPRALFAGGSKPLAFPEWYTMHFFPEDFSRGTGYAGSMIAELYLIGWIPMVILGYFIFGYLFSKLQKYSINTTGMDRNIIYALSIYNVFLLPRYDLASILIDIFFLYLPIILTIKYSRVR